MTYYPNPTQGKVQVSLGQVFEQINCQVINTLGEVIPIQVFENKEQVQPVISRATGLYFIRMTTDTGLESTLMILK
ncbi:MAG: T9SS type A sorting domain-containing protein [Aureispira sp.]